MPTEGAARRGARPTLSTWLPLIAWSGAIFWLSDRPDLPHAGDAMADMLIKKVLHAAGYAVLALLWRRALVAHGVAHATAWAFALTVGYAASDEWHQTFVLGRRGRLSDVAIDAIGAAAGLGAFRLAARHGMGGREMQRDADDAPGRQPDAWWRDRLTPEQYRVLREAGTERPFSGTLLEVSADGLFRCAGCGAELFETAAKFESGCGWPSFSDVRDAGAVELREDRALGMVRTEVRCASCGGHLGHLFDDGPRPTGLRYCINSVALDFDPAAPD